MTTKYINSVVGRHCSIAIHLNSISPDSFYVGSVNDTASTVILDIALGMIKSQNYFKTRFLIFLNFFFQKKLGGYWLVCVLTVASHIALFF